MYSGNKLRINLYLMFPDNIPTGCGYCKNMITGVRNKTSYKYRLRLDSIPIDIYEEMFQKGWSRCGDLIYKTIYGKTCCKLYQPRVNINNFKISNEQKKIMKRFRKYLSGEYEENKIKIKESNKEKIKIEDKYQSKISQKVKEYIDSKIYLDNLKNNIDNNNELENILNKIKDTKIRKNNNKSNKCDYSCDFIFIIQKLLNSKNIKNEKNEKNGIFINNNKNLLLLLYNNFIQYYKPIDEYVYFNEESGHINFQIKNQEEYNKYINNLKKNEKNDKSINLNNNDFNYLNNNIINNNKGNIIKNKNSEKYIFDYFPEIVTEPEIYLPLKHTYSIELTKNITLKAEEERFILYNKYQNAIHKENSTINTYNNNWGLSILEKYKKIPLPQNLFQKTKHPELYPQYYGTYNLIHKIDGKIVAVTVWDILPHYLESVYCYYDPDYSFLDLGVITAIREIEYMKSFHDLIDKNFMYYSMGEMCQSCQKLKYKGNYFPTEIMDHYTGNYILLTEEIKKIIGDNKCHYLTQINETPKLKFFSSIEIEDRYWNLMIDVFGEKVFIDDFLNLYLENENHKKIIINCIRRFLEIIDSETYSKVEFYFDASVLNQYQ